MIDEKLRNILRAWLYFGYSFQMFRHEEAGLLDGVTDEELKAAWDEEEKQFKKGA
jgi:hypothetical protein